MLDAVYLGEQPGASLCRRPPTSAPRERSVSPSQNMLALLRHHLLLGRSLVMVRLVQPVRFDQVKRPTRTAVWFGSAIGGTQALVSLVAGEPWTEVAGRGVIGFATGAVGMWWLVQRRKKTGDAGG
jgi:hypothetical protein